MGQKDSCVASGANFLRPVRTNNFGHNERSDFQWAACNGAAQRSPMSGLSGPRLWLSGLCPGLARAPLIAARNVSNWGGLAPIGVKIGLRAPSRIELFASWECHPRRQRRAVSSLVWPGDFFCGNQGIGPLPAGHFWQKFFTVFAPTFGGRGGGRQPLDSVGILVRFFGSFFAKKS